MEKGITSVVDIIAPSSVEVDFRYITSWRHLLHDIFYRRLSHVMSRRDGLQPIIDYDHTLDIGNVLLSYLFIRCPG